MRYFHDTELHGHALIFDGPLDVVNKAKEHNSTPDSFKPNVSFNWPGRRGRNWDDCVRFIHEPWPEATAIIKQIVDGIKSEDLPQPKSLKRRPRWSENDGDLDLDRVLGGEAEHLREVKRAKSTGPHHVALVSNLDAGKGHSCNASGVWFRSGCCIALADILENLGYTVEIWTWTRGYNVYPRPDHHQFLACRPKVSGDSVDVDALCDTMSAWFTMSATFGAFAAGPVKPSCPKGTAGSLVEAKYNTLDPKESGIGPWYKYLQIDQDTVALSVPMITGWGVQDGIKNAAEVAKELLATICEGQ